MLNYSAEIEGSLGPAESGGLPTEHQRNKDREGRTVSVR